MKPSKPPKKCPTCDAPYQSGFNTRTNDVPIAIYECSTWLEFDEDLGWIMSCGSDPVWDMVAQARPIARAMRRAQARGDTETFIGLFERLQETLGVSRKRHKNIRDDEAGSRPRAGRSAASST